MHYVENSLIGPHVRIPQHNVIRGELFAVYLIYDIYIISYLMKTMYVTEV